MFERELEDYRPWRELALAVVVQATEDYKAAIKAFKKFPSDRTLNAMQRLEWWFYTDTCDLYLQDITTGAEIVNRIRTEMGLDGEDAE